MSEATMECAKCGGALAARVCDRYFDPPIGIGGVILENAVIESRCVTCGIVADITIPDLNGLIAAAALVRSMVATKLKGEEIRFLRRALGWNARTFAAKLNVRHETVSRWENDADAMNPAHEKLLRLAVGENLRQMAPLVTFSVDKIMDMDLRGFRQDDDDVEMVFRLVPLRSKTKATDQPILRKGWESPRAA